MNLNTQTSDLDKQQLLRNFLIVLISFALLSQLQPVIGSVFGGIAGSFGVRQTSHLCIGLSLEGEKAETLFPKGEIEFKAVQFHFRYSVIENGAGIKRDYCVGQDIWFGE